MTCLDLQIQSEQSEKRAQQELVSLQRKLQQTEKRALELMRTQAKQNNLLQHRNSQLKDIAGELKRLQVRISHVLNQCLQGFVLQIMCLHDSLQ
jgi:hypothetical protein